MSFSVSTNLAPEVVLSRASDHLRAVGYKVKAEGVRVRGTNGREYTTWIAVVLFFFFFIPFLIYWFTRPKSTVEVTATSGTCTMTYKGKRGLSEANNLASMLKTQ